MSKSIYKSKVNNQACGFSGNPLASEAGVLTATLWNLFLTYIIIMWLPFSCNVHVFPTDGVEKAKNKTF